ncbi:hypothetical protein COW36_22555 [bacterium (Candidatus Blackallbacteria) CG17_big_fil_post_rev_8_21_14_2_50_48_46]|uniref:Uncharacterized protein n=1 Tax=bacterium (Candidatus Blackallbacteria) CG17_big_fil_post_rev_8_21_14_2_50_48_46 TaxID=2014261 RepID=A0A2M7FXX2_9BACT|nr:MAG: hypothetical protein COW64_07325 [bacterium (Candidatus Blackallbacteria) CG18_big_fil_WC_8_21_14_2_50_49_26]PIW14161.1 MAG: hypothetical protein COW36_22555 [bacterium (Candidatus Blackallbacteria) CG17_big_fil_post_rev_8_21_14_2_50_48_46]PIW46702.1 MAG: hypothetical protein COW20_14830 [bacterium (Candidatus Blackallbacteria) CG13_big_fil_rev_8_21_14_2_50_49_14]
MKPKDKKTGSISGAQSLGFIVSVALFMPLRSQAAQEMQIPAFSCRNGLFAVHAEHHFQRAKVSATAKTYFYEDIENCPQKPTCKTKSYLIQNDPILINQIKGEWVCAWYAGKERETVGWLKRKQISLLSEKAPPQLSDWAGHWVSPQADLKIKQNPDKKSLFLEGQAFWYGAIVNGEKVIHVGSIGSERIEPQQRFLKYSEGEDAWDCKVKFTLLPPFLIVDDNLHCGGQNVSFRGIYQKQKTAYQNKVR